MPGSDVRSVLCVCVWRWCREGLRGSIVFEHSGEGHRGRME
ncbi:unnamed protein product [Calypogeia fissa]